MTFTVLVPNVGERSEWPLNGQNLSISLPITDPVSNTQFNCDVMCTTVFVWL